MKSTIILFFWAIVCTCVHAKPYGFQRGSFRQEDAIVVEAAPMQSVGGNPTSPPVHSPSCRYHVYSNQQSSDDNVAKSRQNYQQINYQPAPEFVRSKSSNYYSSYPQFRTGSAQSDNYYQRQNDIQSSNNYYQHQNDIQSSNNYYQRQNDVKQDFGNEYAQTGSSYESFMVHQDYPTARVVMGYRQIGAAAMNPVQTTKSETKSLMSSYY